MHIEAGLGEVQSSSVEEQMSEQIPAAVKTIMAEETRLGLQPIESPASEAAPMLPKAKSAPGARRAIQWAITFILVAAIGGLGFWAYRLYSDLNAIRQQIITLQSQYDQLKSEHEKLGAELEQKNTELAQSQEDLAAIQADLDKAQDKNQNLQTRVSRATKYLDVVVAIFVNTENERAVMNKVRATQDARLIKLFEESTDKKDIGSAYEFLTYLFETLSDTLKETSALLGLPNA